MLRVRPLDLIEVMYLPNYLRETDGYGFAQTRRDLRISSPLSRIDVWTQAGDSSRRNSKSSVRRRRRKAAVDLLSPPLALGLLFLIFFSGFISAF